MTTKTVPTYFPQLPPERDLKREMEEHIARQLGVVGFHISRKGEQYIATCWIPNRCHMVLVTSDFAGITRFDQEHKRH